jgi:hypothetical protein
MVFVPSAPETKSSQRAVEHEEIAMGFLEVLESSAGIAYTTGPSWYRLRDQHV